MRMRIGMGIGGNHKKNPHSEIVESKSPHIAVMNRRGNMPNNGIFQVGGLKRHKINKSVFY